jgi:FMN phosphatase YigB (HAD superfamily)
MTVAFGHVRAGGDDWQACAARSRSRARLYKPDARMYLRALAGCVPAEALFVDD